MLRIVSAFCMSLTFAASLAVAADGAPQKAQLSAAQIVDKYVAATGGLQAWRAVQTLSLAGKLGVGGNQRASLNVPNANPVPNGASPVVSHRRVDEVQVPFLMELKRPRKLRFELQFNGQAAVQVYDGVNGWKLRPFLNRNEVEPYTAEEMKIASMQSDLDGPLVDYAAKGNRVELDAAEKVEGRDTYKLKLTMKNGQVVHVWIDSQNFLETKIEGAPRRLDGIEHPVEIYFRDYRAVDGLQMPFVLETKVLPVAKNGFGLRDTPVPVERITIEKVEVNPKLEESQFSKPVVGPATGAKAKATAGQS
jgi:hypothetical protein